MTNILQIADVVRSKNAGPFELTLDIIFCNREIFRQVRESGIITKNSVAQLYQIDESKILEMVWFEPAKALKITLLRNRPSGKIGDLDVYGAQQHAPLLALEFPF